MNRTHSFSTKTEEDLLFVEKLKKEARLKGQNFSWVVVQALKQYKANKDQNNGVRREN